MRTMLRIALVGSFLASLCVTTSANAQDGEICFRNVPGVGSCISGRFYEYWRDNGGLPIFGYPLTGEFQQKTTEGTFTVQYFERQRFELHPMIARPYDVLLGRLGDEGLRRQGRDWQKDPVPTSIPGDVCRRFEVTRHIVCGDFLPYWFDHGLNLDADPARSYAESLALFGLPLTEAATETNADRFRVRTQWFERSRFEFYPNNPDPYKVLLGRVGAEALNGVANSVGGVSVGHNAATHVLKIESQRDGSVTSVTYGPATAIRCFNGKPAPPNILDKPDIFVSATGVYNAGGVLAADTITTPACE